MTRPFKGNFIVERELWNGFKELCQANGTTATEELTAFIQLSVSQGELSSSPGMALPPTVLTIKDAIEFQLTNYIDHVIDAKTKQLNDKLAQFRREIKPQENIDTYIDTDRDTDEQLENQTSTYGDTYNDTDRPKENQSSPPPDTDSNTYNDTDNDNGTTQPVKQKKQNTPNEKPTTALEVILGGKDDIEYPDNDKQPPMLTDGMVALIEKVSTETIRRYRAGQRKPKPDFWERWRISSRNPKRWEEIE